MTKQTTDTNNELNYDENVIAKIVGKTLMGIPGVLMVHGNVFENLTDRFSNDDDPTKGIKVDLDADNKTVDVDMDATLEYGKNAPQIFNEAVTKIKAAVGSMTDVKVNAVKMTVKDLMTKAEWDAQNKPKDADEPR
ncbi:general stress protein [Agrilactobacillus composti DSM 18527 = JCM 14202]|uniref:Stress response regulator gls24 homolog n=2 Tax=Agrilactobacillus TaxID=2767875 RepID=A0A0R1Y1G7_9LACO|nr:general stress protein [Agrilactobacillus composti DSM 18527 = JCM 14202]